MLSILIKTSRILGLKILDEKNMSQFADDTTLFWKDMDQILLTIQTVDFFLGPRVYILTWKSVKFWPYMTASYKLYFHNFTQHNTPIWNNRCILLNRKSIFKVEWYSKGVWAVAYWLDENGNLLQYIEFYFLKKANKSIYCSLKEYTIIMKAIPISLLMMVKEDG